MATERVEEMTKWLIHHIDQCQDSTCPCELIGGDGWAELFDEAADSRVQAALAPLRTEIADLRGMYKMVFEAGEKRVAALRDMERQRDELRERSKRIVALVDAMGGMAETYDGVRMIRELAASPPVEGGLKGQQG